MPPSTVEYDPPTSIIPETVLPGSGSDTPRSILPIECELVFTLLIRPDSFVALALSEIRESKYPFTSIVGMDTISDHRPSSSTDTLVQFESFLTNSICPPGFSFLYEYDVLISTFSILTVPMSLLFSIPLKE